MQTKDHVISAIDALIRINYNNAIQTRSNIQAAIEQLTKALDQSTIEDERLNHPDSDLGWSLVKIGRR